MSAEWHRIGKPKTVPITKTLARRHANMPAITHDRNFQQYRVKDYLDEIENGQFRSVEWATCYCKANGITYRTNGKHTSIMYMDMVEIPPDSYAIVEEFEAETMEGVVACYNSFDRPIIGKKTADINKAVAGSIPELVNVPLRLINAIVSGINYARKREQYAAVKSVTRAQVLREYCAFVLWMDNLLAGQFSDVGKSLRRTGIVAAIFLTYQKDKEAAGEFWPAVRDETGPKPKLPDRMLAKYINEHVSTTGGGPQVRSIAGQRNNRQFHVTSINCWNSWRTNNGPPDMKAGPNDKVPPVL